MVLRLTIKQPWISPTSAKLPDIPFQSQSALPYSTLRIQAAFESRSTQSAYGTMSPPMGGGAFAATGAATICPRPPWRGRSMDLNMDLVGSLSEDPDAEGLAIAPTPFGRSSCLTCPADDLRPRAQVQFTFNCQQIRKILVSLLCIDSFELMHSLVTFEDGINCKCVSRQRYSRNSMEKLLTHGNIQACLRPMDLGT